MISKGQFVGEAKAIFDQTNEHRYGVERPTDHLKCENALNFVKVPNPRSAPHP